MSADQGIPITNTLFPPPPVYYKAFTQEALDRYTELGGPSSSRDASPSAQKQLSAEETQEFGRLTDALEHPRSDWVKEDGRWAAFGQQYYTSPTIPTAASIGLQPLIDADQPPQQSLPPLLHSFLHTLLLLLDTLTTSARTPGELEEKGWGHEGDQHLTNIAATLMVEANQLRGVQAESSLVLLMERQLQERRVQTQLLRDKCRDIARDIKLVRQETLALLNSPSGA